MVVVVIVLATFDPNAYKPRIVQMVKEKTGRTLAIHGDIGLAFFPKIGADIPRTTLSERGSAKEFAGVDRVRIHVALLPLLRKRVVVDEVRLEGLRANLVKFKDGTTNFSDLIPKGGKKARRRPASRRHPAALRIRRGRRPNSELAPRLERRDDGPRLGR